jgi:hypothetical protein
MNYTHAALVQLVEKGHHTSYSFLHHSQLNAHMVLFSNTFSTHNLMKNGVLLLADDELTTSTTMCITGVDPH